MSPASEAQRSCGLRDRPDPIAAPDHVAIAVSAIPLLWLDTVTRTAKGQDWFPLSLCTWRVTASRGQSAAPGQVARERTSD
jgi:hypothetical protein